MTVRERTRTSVQERLIAELLQNHPPVRQLEELMGPEPTPDEIGEVDAFLQARSEWQRPYSGTPGTR